MGDAAGHLLLDRCEDFDRELLTNFHRIGLDLDSLTSVFIVYQVELVITPVVLSSELFGSEKFFHVLEASFGNDDLTAARGAAL